MGIWDVEQTLLPFPNDSNWTLQQKSWRVHVEQVARKCFNRSKKDNLSFIVMLLWLGLNNGLECLHGSGT